MLGTDPLLFVAASAALIVSPGPDNIYVMTRGVAQGRGAALVSAVGVCCGLIVHTTFAAVGLSALLASSAAAFLVVKYAGAAYLLYLGARMLLDRERLSVGRAPKAGLRRVFVQGVASNVLNPKVALFFLAFLPQFVDPRAGVAVQMLGLGSAFAALGLVFLCTLALASGSVGDWLSRRPRYAGALRWLSGSVLIGLGLRLALAERR